MESSTLAPVLSYILTKMVERNDKIPLDDSKRTVFHAHKAPLISLQRYLERVLSFAPCSNSCFIIALIYIDRIIQNSDFILNSLSVHRMLITSVMVATKFFDDETFNNLYYAKVGGLQVNEVNQLEYKFLSLIDFSLAICSDLYGRYHCELVKHAKVNANVKSGAHVSPLRSQLSCESLQFQKASEKSFHPLSRSTSSLSTKSVCIAAKPSSKSTSRLLSQSTQSLSPQFTSQTPAQIRDICETLIEETVKNTAIQSQLMGRVTELLSAEEKLHRKLSPGCIKTMCAKLAVEHNLPQSFIAQAALRAEQLECESKSTSTLLSSSPPSSSTYQHGFDYTARDMIPTSLDTSGITSKASVSTSTNTSTSSSNGEGGNSGLSTGAMKGRAANFSACTPTYPNNHHIYGNRLLGVI